MESHSTSPLIIIGMHRSGTSLVARILERLGLFLGSRKDPNHEALFFQSLNEWIFRQCGGAWDQPDPVKLLQTDTAVRPMVEDHLRRVIDSPRAVKYLGIRGYLIHRSLMNLDRPWGWKDPRNTFTLPVWLRLFPDARVLHVCRHGVDVARSLQQRRERTIEKLQHARRREGRVSWIRTERMKFVDTLRCRRLEDGLSLWETYMIEAKRHIADLETNAMEIRYEDLLSDPVNRLRVLSRFSGLTITDEKLENASGEIDRSHAFAYRQSRDLRALACAAADGLKRFGYDR